MSDKTRNAREEETELNVELYLKEPDSRGVQRSPQRMRHSTVHKKQIS